MSEPIYITCTWCGWGFNRLDVLKQHWDKTHDAAWNALMLLRPSGYLDGCPCPACQAHQAAVERITTPVRAHDGERVT